MTPLNEKLKATALFIKPKNGTQWTVAVAALLLVMIPLIYIIATPPHISDTLTQNARSSSLYKRATVQEAVGQPCDQEKGDGKTDDRGEPESNAPVSAFDECISMVINISDYGQQQVRGSKGITLPDVPPGTRIVVVNRDNGTSNTWEMVGIDHSNAVLILAVLLALAMLILTGVKGIDTLLASAASLAIAFTYLVPALLAGHNAAMTSIAVGIACTAIIVYIGHGISWTTIIAAITSTLGLLIAFGLGTLFDISTKTNTVISDDFSQLLSAYLPAPPSSLGYLYTVSLTILAVGILAPLNVTLVRSLRESQARNPNQGIISFVWSGLRDIQSQTTAALYAILFTFAATAIPLLITTYFAHHGSLAALMSSEFSVMTLRTGVGMLSALVSLPITGFAVGLLKGKMPLRASLGDDRESVASTHKP